MDFENLIMQEGTYYHWREIDKEIITPSDFEIVQKINIVKKKRVITEYYNIPCSFDIETSSFYQKGTKRALMYIWQFCFNGKVYYGRTWEEFEEFMFVLNIKLGITPKRRLVIYVHNLAYEFQFMRKWFEWNSVFTIKRRKVAYALTTSGFEFRCSLILSGAKLADVGKEMLFKYKLQKMEGDLDYSLLRNSKTKLSDKEMRYCENDVRVVCAYIKERMEADGDVTKIPMTATGYVRKRVREAMIVGNSEGAKRNRKLIKKLVIDPIEYILLKEGYAGGFTHANISRVGRVFKWVASFDLTSSYPTVMLLEKYPMGKGTKIDIKEKNISFWRKNNCLLMRIKMKNITPKFEYESYLSYSKCRNVKGEILNNGRILQADYLETTITEVDYDVIKQIYNCDIEIVETYAYKKDYLPKEFIEVLLELYKKKTQLKGVKGREDEYQRYKGDFNSCYGMLIMDIIREVTEYQGEWTEPYKPEDGTLEYMKILNKYNKSKTRFGFYAWGCWVCAYARRNLFEAILTIGIDYLYSDTDSVKITNYEKYLPFFESYKQDIIKKIKKVSYVYNLNYDDFQPKDIKGERHLIGEWTFEGVYDEFKTMGAKRYMTRKGDKIEITIAGLSKKEGANYIKSQEEPFEYFNDEMQIPAGSSGRNTLTYIDEGIEDEITDYQGNKARYKEKSFIHMEQSEFNMSLSSTFTNLLKNYQDVVII